MKKREKEAEIRIFEGSRILFKQIQRRKKENKNEKSKEKKKFQEESIKLQLVRNN